MKKKKLVALLTAAALTAGSLMGCGSLDGSKTVATLDGKEIPLSIANFMAQYNAVIYDQFYMGYYGEGMWNTDLFGEGQTMTDSVKEYILEQIEEMYVIDAHAAELGVSLTADELAAIDKAADAFIEDNIDKVEKIMTADKDSIKEYLRLITLRNKVQLKIAEGIDTEVAEEETKAKKIEYIKVSKTEVEGEVDPLTATEKMLKYIVYGDEESGKDVEAYKGREIILATGDDNTENTDETIEYVPETYETEVEEVETTEVDLTGGEDGEVVEAVEEVTETVTDEAAVEEVVEETATEEVPVEEVVEETAEVVEEAPAEESAEETDAFVDAAVKYGYTVSSCTFVKNDLSEDKNSTPVPTSVLGSVNELADGEVSKKYVESDDAYYIVRMVNSNDEEATDSNVKAILNERKSELFEKTVDEWSSSVSWNVNEDVWKKVNFDVIFVVPNADEAE